MRIRSRILTSRLAKLYRVVRSLIHDFRPAWVDQAPIIKKAFEEKFASGPFRPVSKATIAWRKRRGFSTSSPPLTASGKLRASLQGGPDHVEEVYRKSLSIGTRNPIAAPHQFGATVIQRFKSPAQKLSGRGRKSKRIIGKTIIPARPFTPESDPGFLVKSAKAMERFLLSWIQKNVGDSPE